MDLRGFRNSLNFVIKDTAFDRPVLILCVNEHILAVVADSKYARFATV